MPFNSGSSVGNPETSHIFKPLLNAVLYFRNLEINVTFGFRFSNITQSWFVAQSIFNAKFGSVFTYRAKFFCNNFLNYLAKKKERSVQRKFGKYIAFNVLRLKNVAKNQHQAFTNITKTLN